MAATAETSWLSEDRETAWKAFLAEPDPAKTVEAWRKTPFSAFGLGGLANARPAADKRFGTAQLSQSALEAGAAVASLVDVADRPEVRARLTAAWASPEYRKLELANRARWEGGWYVDVPAGVRLAEPIRVAFEGPAGYAFPRVLVVLGDGAEATFVEEHRGSLPDTSVAFSKVVLGRGAKAHVVYQQELGPKVRHFWHQTCELAESAELIHASLVLGGELHKNHLEVELAGAGGRSELYGVTLGERDQHFDSLTVQRHRAPKTFSDLVFRSVLRGRSRALYNGLIRIEPAARGAEAFQSDHNLLLSKEARADSTPILEILTDEVACKHAATAGPLDADELFYLATRGFSEEEAVRTLVLGFLEPVLKRLPIDAERERILTELEARL